MTKTAYALCLAAAFTLAAPAILRAYTEDRGFETLRGSGTNTLPYTRVAPNGNVVHYYIQNGYYNPYTTQRDNRVGPPVGFGPDTQGNWYGNMGGMGYPSQQNIDWFAKPSRR